MSVTTFLSQILLSAQMGFGGSERVWNGLEGSLDGPIRVPGESWEGLGVLARVFSVYTGWCWVRIWVESCVVKFWHE